MNRRNPRASAQSSPRRRARRIATALFAAGAVLAAPGPASAVDWTGVGGQDFNNFFNWNPLGVPDNTEAAVIGLDSANVTTSAYCHVEDLTLLNGAELTLSNGGMLVDDRVLLNRTTGSFVELSIFNTPAALDLDTNYLDILAGAFLTMEGGIAQVDLDLNNLSGYVSGHGVIEMSGSPANQFNNDSSINVTGGTLSLHAPNGAKLNLDGASGNGLIYVTESTSDLIVDGPLLDSFNGILNVGDGNTVTFAHGWTLGSALVGDAGFLNMNGNGGGGAAIVDGLSSVIGGIIEVSGQGRLASSTIEFTNSAHVQVDAGATLSLVGETTFAGGLYTGVGQISQDGDAIFTANTTIETGSYDMDGSSGGSRITIENLVQVNLDVVEIDDSSNFYDGELVLEGGRLMVDTSTNSWTMAGSLEMDGSSFSPILTGDNVNLTGAVDVTGAAPARLSSALTYFYNSTDVTVAAGSTLAVADTMVYGGQFQGGTLRNEGDMLVMNNDVTFNHPTFDMDGDEALGNLTVSFGSLTINANSLEDDDAGFDGLLLVESSGELIVNTPSTWSIAAGTLRLGGPGALVSGQDLAVVDSDGRIEGIGALLVDVTNAGVISPGIGAGVGVLEISQDLTLLPTSTLDIEIGGETPAQYDRLFVVQNSVLGGTLDLTVVNGFIPEYGDAYTILTTNGELVECFTGIAGQDIVGPLVLAHDYTAVGVVIRPTVPGDANFDGTVTGADFTLWADHFGGDCPDFGQGDFNGDGATTGADFTIWADHFGATAPAAVAVPEPSSLLWALAAGLLMFVRPWRRPRG